MCVHVCGCLGTAGLCSFSLSNEGLRHCLSERDVSCDNLLAASVAPCVDYIV